MGTLGGILADCGKLDPDAPVARYIPEMEGSVYGGTCTVRHLLAMSAGLRFDEDYMARDSDDYRRSTGWEPPAAGVPTTHLRQYLETLWPDGTPHGQTFHYVLTNTDVLGWVYERACGERQLSQQVVHDRCHSAFAAVGIHGQWVYVDPASELVIARVLAAVADGSRPRSHVAVRLSHDSNQAGRARLRLGIACGCDSRRSESRSIRPM